MLFDFEPQSLEEPDASSVNRFKHVNLPHYRFDWFRRVVLRLIISIRTRFRKNYFTFDKTAFVNGEIRHMGEQVKLHR